MKRLRWCAWMIVLVAPFASPQKVDSDARAEQIIQMLDLHVAPKESGYVGVIGVTPSAVAINGRDLAVQSQSYAMLTRATNMRYLHYLEPADTEVLIEGGPVDFYLFYPDGHAEKQVLGMNLKAGERPVIAVPPGCWKSLVLRPGVAYALIVNALSPEFTTDREKIGEGPAWVKRFAGRAPWATPERLRMLIGPNWIP